VEAAGVEPASETILKSGHSQVCLDFFGVQNSYPQISRFLCGLGSPPAIAGYHFGLVIFGGTNHLSDIGKQGHRKPRDYAASA